MRQTNEASFESVVEQYLLDAGKTGKGSRAVDEVDEQLLVKQDNSTPKSTDWFVWPIIAASQVF